MLFVLAIFISALHQATSQNCNCLNLQQCILARNQQRSNVRQNCLNTCQAQLGAINVAGVTQCYRNYETSKLAVDTQGINCVLRNTGVCTGIINNPPVINGAASPFGTSSNYNNYNAYNAFRLSGRKKRQSSSFSTNNAQINAFNQCVASCYCNQASSQGLFSQGTSTYSSYYGSYIYGRKKREATRCTLNDALFCGNQQGCVIPQQTYINAAQTCDTASNLVNQYNQLGITRCSCIQQALGNPIGFTCTNTLVTTTFTVNNGAYGYGYPYRYNTYGTNYVVSGRGYYDALDKIAMDYSVGHNRH